MLASANKLVGEPSAQTTKETTLDKMSASALEAVQRSVLSGVVKSMAIYCLRNNLEQSKVKAKIVTLVNAMRAAEDISEEDQTWMSTHWLDSIFQNNHQDPSCCCSCYDYATVDWYIILDNICNDQKADEWCFGDTDKLSEKESAIVNKLRAARSAYYEAQHDFDEYFRSCTKEAVINVLRKYATTMAQIAPEWYKLASEISGLAKRDYSAEETAEQ